MRRISPYILFTIAYSMLSSCYIDHPVSAPTILPNICPSDCLSEVLCVKAFKINQTADLSQEYLDYTSIEDLCISFSPLFDISKYSQKCQSDNKRDAIRKWGNEKLYSLNIEVYDDNSNAPVANYSTSFISGNLVISSDSSLFGESPGDNISNHFKMNFRNVYSSYRGSILKSDKYIIVYPAYNLSSSNFPLEISEYFTNDEVIFCSPVNSMSSRPDDGYCIVFKDYPKNDLTEFTLKISIPIRDQFILDAFKDDGTYDSNKIIERDRVLVGSIKIKVN